MCLCNEVYTSYLGVLRYSYETITIHDLYHGNPYIQRHRQCYTSDTLHKISCGIFDSPQEVK